MKFETKEPSSVNGSAVQPQPAPTKVIVSIRRNLIKKYGRNIGMLDDQLARLVTDLRFSTELVYLDDVDTMKAYGLGAIPSPLTYKACKDWIDAVFRKKNPNYLVIFGSYDVVPHQALDNPVLGVGRDTDIKVPSDLPYASETPYDTDIAKFRNPTRVVGRIPDIPGIADVNHVTRQIDFILASVPAPRADYERHIGLSAEKWAASTGESLRKLFKADPNQENFPPTVNPPIPPLGARTHFINCHGALSDPTFLGEDPSGALHPLALDALNVPGIPQGTVVAAECCYGVQVYKPEWYRRKSIASTYMENGAVGFMGSSTIAYGPPDGNDQADILCQDFLLSILEGASTGRALLQSRQKYIKLKEPHLDPYDLKTIAQFYLLGDPSVQPVILSPTVQTTIQERRIKLKDEGHTCGKKTLAAKKVEAVEKFENAVMTKDVNDTIKALLDKDNFGDREQVFEISADPDSGDIAPARFRIFESRESISAEAAISKIRSFRVMIIKEDGKGGIISRVCVAK